MLFGIPPNSPGICSSLFLLLMLLETNKAENEIDGENTPFFVPFTFVDKNRNMGAAVVEVYGCNPTTITPLALIKVSSI